MTNFISYNQYNKEYAINETYESYIELKELARNILNSYERDGPIYFLKTFVKKDYAVLKDFVNAKIGVTFQEPVKLSLGGKFLSPPLTDTGERKKISNNYIYSDGVIVIYDVNFSTILHELQHAYDSFRSNGKFIRSKITYQSVNAQQNRDPVDKRARLYHRSPHELSSFFVEAINKIEFFDYNDEIRRFDYVYYTFKKEFKVYNYLSPKIKKDLLRKLSQYYYKIKDEHKKNK